MKLYIAGFIQINKKVLIPLLFIAIFTLVAFPRAILAQDDPAAWKNNWGVLEGFAIVKDTEGYALPSAISFVPNPGSGPKDPLYFVTELRGTIKVITNDRTVFTFAEDFFSIDEDRGLTEYTDEFGLAGICLDPSNGYVFVTYSYRAQDNKLRNNISRFETTPNTFSLRPAKTTDYREIFFPFKTDASHQIGGCQVNDNYLYVSIGDSLNEEIPPIALDSLRGKVLRFSLDVQPVPQNPFYQSNDPDSPVNYVWATGLRNPFGIKVVAGRVFIADNGRSIDRFLEVRAGGDYLWNGTDWSIGAAADVSFSPAIGPTQLEHIPKGSSEFLPGYENTFFIGMSGRSIRGIVNVRYDFDANQVTQPPEPFILYLGSHSNEYEGIVVGVALGPDGLYFAPMTEGGVESGVVYRIFYDPDNQHALRPNDVTNPVVLLTTQGCLACHSIRGQGSSRAPVLDYAPLVERLDERLNSDDYLRILSQIDALDTEPYVEYTDARQEVRQNEGFDRLRFWLYYHLLEPKFDNPDSQMPNVGLSKEQALILTDYLLTEPSIQSSANPGQDPQQSQDLDSSQDSNLTQSQNPLVRLISSIIPLVGYRHLLVFFIVGVLAGMLFLWLVGWLRAKRSSD